MRLNKENIIVLLIAVFIFFFPFRKLWTEPRMLAWGDNQPLPVSSAQAFKGFITAWQPMSRGVSNGQTISMVIQGLLIKISNDNSVTAQKIYLFLPFTLAFIFSFLFLSIYVKNRWALLISSLFYAFNPGTFGSLTGGAIGLIYVHAFLPLAYYLIFRFYSFTNSFRARLLCFSLISLTLSILFIFGSYSLILVLPAFFYLFIKTALKKEKMALLGYFLSAFLMMAAVFFLTLPTAFDFLGFFKSDVTSQAASLNVDSLLSEVRSNYLNVLGNSLDLAGTYSIFSILRKLRFLGVFLIFALFFPLIIWKKMKEDKRRIVGLNLGLLLFIWIFMMLTAKGVTLPIFRQFNFLFLFRSPAKLILFTTLIYSSLIAVTVQEILERLHKRAKVFCLLLFFFVLLLFNYPFLEGSLLLEMTKSGYPDYRISENFVTVSHWLRDVKKGELGSFRTLWLPYTYEEEEIKLRFLDENQANSPLGLSQFLSFGESYLGKIHKYICEDNSQDDLSSVLSEISIKYIILNGASAQRGLCSGDKLNLSADPEMIRERLAKNPGLLLANRIGNIYIYENKNWYPKIVSVLEASSGDKRDLKFPGKIIESKRDYSTYEVFGLENSKTFYLSEFYHPGWEAFVDGKKIEHLRGRGVGNYFVNNSSSQGILTIKFMGQYQRDLTLRIWTYGWLLWAAIFLFGLSGFFLRL